jgi:release factor glutamine methyltransferase
MPAVGDLLDAAADVARLDAEVLLAHCLQKPRSFLYAWPDHEVDAALAEDYTFLLCRLAAGEPLAYLTGQREFWSLPLRVNRATLIPRPETETLVAAALALPLPGDARVADWGTGSGAIALALKSERRRWQVTASDASAAALAVAVENARALALPIQAVLSDWGGAFADATLDLLVSNPPYIAEGDPHLAADGLRFEPQTALVAGRSGLADIERIVIEAWRVLARGGWLLLEHGYDQADSVRDRLQASGFRSLRSWTDLAGIERVSGGRKP